MCFIPPIFSFEITSKQGEGTTVTAVFDTANIDCPPLGDINGTMVSQFICHEDVDFIYTYTADGGRMEFDTREVKAALGGIPLSSPEVVSWMRDSLRDELAGIGADGN